MKTGRLVRKQFQYFKEEMTKSLVIIAEIVNIVGFGIYFGSRANKSW